MTELTDSALQAFVLVVLLSGIPLLLSALIGFTISILQAATQIQEQTLSFLPRLVAVGAVLFFFGPWMAEQLRVFSEELLLRLPAVTLGGG